MSVPDPIGAMLSRTTPAEPLKRFMREKIKVLIIALNDPPKVVREGRGKEGRVSVAAFMKSMLSHYPKRLC